MRLPFHELGLAQAGHGQLGEERLGEQVGALGVVGARGVEEGAGAAPASLEELVEAPTQPLDLLDGSDAIDGQVAVLVEEGDLVVVDVDLEGRGGRWCVHVGFPLVAPARPDGRAV